MTRIFNGRGKQIFEIRKYLTKILRYALNVSSSIVLALQNFPEIINNALVYLRVSHLSKLI